MKRAFLLTGLLALCLSCGGPSSGGSSEGEALDRPFAQPSIPGLIVDPDDRAAYLAEHYWDAYFAGDGRCDSAVLLGVSVPELEQAVATWCGLLEEMPVADAQKAVEKTFDAMEARHAADTSEHVYARFGEIIIRYLYDPNSPLRSEDLYLPFVRRLLQSPYTPEDMLPAYRYEARMCAINPIGAKVPDFRFKMLSGRVSTLYAVRAEYLMLFFSNPGCQACKGIVDEVMGHPGIPEMLASGRLAVVNLYIDEDIAAWRAYAENYPGSWISGYDPDGVIRADRLYCVRAIPSLYLLDAEKCVILRDAPTERVLAYLDKTQEIKFL